MSAWRSPLLFLGFLLIAIAGAALMAPLFVDWSSYRAEFEEYGRKVTGRDVTISGPIEARLFPWPALVLGQVRIANVEGARHSHVMDAGRIEMGMSLAPLMSGQIEVDTIAIDSPVFAFERLASGAASFDVDLDRGLPALIDPDRVLISEISITNGTVFAGDHRRDGMMRIDELAGTLSAPALSGPWRFSATASHAGSPFEINLTTGKLKAGEPARLALRIGPVADAAGMVYSFDGEGARPESERGTGKSLKGAIKIAPSPSQGGKGETESGLPRFEARADIEADFNSVILSRIEASPAFSTDPGNFITGTAGIDFGSRIVIDAALSTARVDLDQIAGRRGGTPMLSADAFEELALFLARLPETLELYVDLAAASVIVGGETHEASRLKFALDGERLRIEELTTALPGQTRTSFSGLMVFGDAPLLSGDLSLESVSLRDFVVWAVPEQRRAVEQVWNGIRGRLKLDAKVDATADSLRISEVAATLDGSPVTGNLTAQGAPDRGLALRIDADRVDLDRYLPRGFEEWSGAGLGGKGLAKTLSGLVAGAMTVGDFQLTAQAGELKFHGVEARDIAIDLGADENVVEIRTVEIGQVQSARMDVSGVLSFPGEGVAGSVNAVIDAEDPRALMRLLGIIGPEVALEPDWAAALGPLDVRLIAEAGVEDKLTTASMALSGRAGEAVATIEGQFRGEPVRWREAEIELAGELDERTSALLAAVTGLRLDDRRARPSRLAGSLAGSFGEGLSTTLEAELLGASAQFIGTLKQGRRMVEAQGRVAVLAEDAAELFAVAGVPEDSLDSGAQVLAAESEVTYDGRGLRFSTLSGTAAGAAFSADVNFVFEPVRRVSGKIATESLSLPWLLGAILLPRDGNPLALSSHFASAVPGLEADLTIAAERLDVLPHIAFESSDLALKVGRYDVLLSGRGSGPGGEPATGRIAIELDSRGVSMEGALTGPVALGALLQAGDGSPVIEADGKVELAFSGNGRSPAGVLAGLQAEGSYELAQGVLRRVDPEGFARDLAAAKQPSQIDRLFTASLRGGDMAFMGGKGSLAFTDGVLQAKPLAIMGDGLTGEARFVLEAASGDVDLSFTLSLADRHNIPPFELAFAGPPQALEPSTDAQNLKSYLSMQMLQESVQQLEELQRQEEELIEEEKQFQRDQEERERQRLEQERRDAELKLDRKELEGAARLRAEKQQAEKLKVEQRKADRQALELLTKPAVAAEDADAVLQASEPYPQPDPKPAAPSADRLSALPLQEPQEAPVAIESAAAAPGDSVPVPRLKPEHEPDRAALEPARKPVQLPPDGNLGRIPEPVFSGPTILQPHLSPTPPGQGLR